MLITHDIKEVSEIISHCGVIAYPTEAVFGLGCHPDCEESIQRILAIKQRPSSKGFILIASSIDQLYKYIQPLKENYIKKIITATTTPVTWIVPARENISPLLTGSFATLAIRITKHPESKALCEEFGHPLLSTSANPASLHPAKSVEQLIQYFPTGIDAVFDAKLGDFNEPSSIVDIVTDKIFR